MTTIIEQAREVWCAKQERLTREDWVLIGDALVSGKGWCAEHDGYGGPKGFGKWCKENGFDGIDANTRSAITWIVERSEERERYLYHEAHDIKENPHWFYRARIEVLRADDRRTQGQQIFDLVIAQPGISSVELAQQTGIRANTVGARLRDFEKAGTLARIVGDDDKTAGWKPRATDEPKTQPVDKSKPDTVEGRLQAEAKSANVSVPELILRKIAEDMYWLNVMLSREMNSGTTTTAQATVQQQQKKFSEWASSFHEASGRTAVRTQKSANAVSLGVKPFSAVPICVRFEVSLGNE